MANNRIYLRCKACGEEFFLGKRFSDGYSCEHAYCGELNMKTALNLFYSRHEMCNEKGLDCFDLVYEFPPEFSADDADSDVGMVQYIKLKEAALVIDKCKTRREALAELGMLPAIWYWEDETDAKFHN